MTVEEIIHSLEEQAQDKTSFVDKDDPDDVFTRDIEALREAVKLLRKTEPPNPPLTLEELREMGGKPYWHVGLQKDSPPPHWNILDPLYARHIEDYGYGKRWLAYRRKPEEVLRQ